ncbi:baeRF2 domain-containing protein [Planctomonas psychrotolerans]|uniref:baeRF2 domain-containing protein n=1 Tax=Planctomonas psychrotolerans TaxID=2528712 RepID=UPI001D0D485A|nr:Vms1/Ankzf1 family peptidyl-tRNA hydrolase [Planctomonas psychrotolerans]
MTKATESSRQLADLYRRPGSWTSVYVDVSDDVTNAKRASHQRSFRATLQDAGAPPADIDAVERLLDSPTGVGGPLCRFLLLRDGEVEVNELLQGAPLLPEIASHGTVPELLPLLRHRPLDLSYVVAEVGRDGGEIRLHRLGRIGPVSEESVVGRTDFLSKVQVGGWSQARYQHHTEEIWKHNAGDLATVLDRIVLEHSVALLLLSGDIRARQLLAEQLSPAARGVLSTVNSHTRPDGAADDDLVHRLAAELDGILERHEADALDRLAEREGQGDGLGITGLEGVVPALQQAQVDTLLLCPDDLAERTLLALDAEPWVAAHDGDTLTAGVLGEIPAASAMVRAAILTDAQVLLVDPKHVPGDVPVGATLRWPTAPAQ